MRIAKLTDLRNKLQQYYNLFKIGTISEKEYLRKIKPIDNAIDKIEMSTLKKYFYLKKSSLLPSHRQES